MFRIIVLLSNLYYRTKKAHKEGRFEKCRIFISALVGWFGVEGGGVEIAQEAYDLVSRNLNS